MNRAGSGTTKGDDDHPAQAPRPLRRAHRPRRGRRPGRADAGPARAAGQGCPGDLTRRDSLTGHRLLSVALLSQTDVLRRVLPESPRVRPHLGRHRGEEGVHPVADRILLLRVDVEVEEPGREADVRHRRHVDVEPLGVALHHLHVDLVLVHPHRHQVGLVPDVDLLAVRPAVVGEQERGLVDAVDVAVGRQPVLDAGEVQRGVEEIHQVEELVALAAGLDHPAPVGDAGDAHAALPGRALGAAEGRVARVRPAIELRAVVGGDEDEGVVEHARLVERIDDLADVGVDLHHVVLVGIFRGAPALERLRGEVVGVHLHEGVLEEERLAARRQLRDLRERELLQHPVALGHLLDAVDDLDVGGLAALEAVDERVARPGPAQHLQPFGVQHQVGIASLVDALADLLLGLVEAVELVEADVVRPHALRLADVPLARQHRGVAGFAEQRRQRDLVRPGVLRDLVAGEDRPGQPGPDRQPSGQDRRPGRRAGRLRIGRGQLQPLARQPVHVRRRRPDRRAAAEGAGVAVAHVVDDEPDDVRPPAGLGEERVELRLRGRRLVGMRPAPAPGSRSCAPPCSAPTARPQDRRREPARRREAASSASPSRSPRALARLRAAYRARSR